MRKYSLFSANSVSFDFRQYSEDFIQLHKLNGTSQHDKLMIYSSRIRYNIRRKAIRMQVISTHLYMTR